MKTQTKNRLDALLMHIMMDSAPGNFPDTMHTVYRDLIGPRGATTPFVWLLDHAMVTHDSQWRWYVTEKGKAFVNAGGDDGADCEG